MFPPHNLSCCLCKLQIKIDDTEMTRFKTHMHDHDIFYQHEVLLSINFLNAAEIIDICDLVKFRREKFLQSGDLDL